MRNSAAIMLSSIFGLSVATYAIAGIALCIHNATEEKKLSECVQSTTEEEQSFESIDEKVNRARKIIYNCSKGIIDNLSDNFRM